MNFLKSIPSLLWKIWLVICFVLPFFILFPFFYLTLITKQFSLVFKLKRLWSSLICFGAFLYPKIRYESKKYKLPSPCIIVSNHTSYLDILFIPFYIDHAAVSFGGSHSRNVSLPASPNPVSCEWVVIQTLRRPGRRAA